VWPEAVAAKHVAEAAVRLDGSGIQLKVPKAEVDVESAGIDQCWSFCIIAFPHLTE
jgi:hypothetical protein